MLDGIEDAMESKGETSSSFERILERVVLRGTSLTLVDELLYLKRSFSEEDEILFKVLMRICAGNEACATKCFRDEEVMVFLETCLQRGAMYANEKLCKNVLCVLINAMQCVEETLKSEIFERFVFKNIEDTSVPTQCGFWTFTHLPNMFPDLQNVLAHFALCAVRKNSTKSGRNVDDSTKKKTKKTESLKRLTKMTSSVYFCCHIFGNLLLSSRKDDFESYHILESLLEHIVDAEQFPTLFRNLHPNAIYHAKRKDAILRANLLNEIDNNGDTEGDKKKLIKIDVDFCDEQSTLMHFLAQIAVKPERSKGIESVNDENPYVLPESTLAFVLDMTLESAKVWKQQRHDRNDITYAKHVLRECLFTLRCISEVEQKPHSPDTFGFLAGIGVIRLLVGMIVALNPPSGSRQSSRATGPASAPKEVLKFPIDDNTLGTTFVLDNFPTVKPYCGYRVDIIATLANASHRRARVCEDIRKFGGVAVVLSHTRGEEGDTDAFDEEPFLREWALWGTRNLCETDDLIRKEIEVLAPEKILEAEELLRRGLKAELNPETGKPRVVSIIHDSKVEMETMDALGKKMASSSSKISSSETKQDEEDVEEEFVIPKNWKVTEL
jgi:hypothetical protein